MDILTIFFVFLLLFTCRLLLDSLQAICHLARSTFGNCRQHQSISHFLRLLIELGVPQDSSTANSPPFVFSLMYIFQIKLLLRIVQNKIQLFSSFQRAFEKYQWSKLCIVKSREAIRFVLHSLHC